MSPCGARDLWLRYAQAPARDKVAVWARLLSAHAGRFLGQCSGSVTMRSPEPCDRAGGCMVPTEREAYLVWLAAGRPGAPLPWLEFQAAHGGRCYVPRRARQFGADGP